MPQIPSYPSVQGDLSGNEIVLGYAGGRTATITAAQLTALAIEMLMNGTFASGLADEANDDAIPAAGSGRPYLSAGVLKFA